MLMTGPSTLLEDEDKKMTKILKLPRKHMTCEIFSNILIPFSPRLFKAVEWIINHSCFINSTACNV